MKLFTERIRKIAFPEFFKVEESFLSENLRENVRLKMVPYFITEDRLPLMITHSSLEEPYDNPVFHRSLSVLRHPVFTKSAIIS